MDLSIIIVNWKSAHFLTKCLQTVFAETQNISFEVIVVDNASYDGVAELLAREFPQVKFVQSGSNLGFAGANNLGFQYSSGRNILLLNPDTEVIGPALQTMVAALETLPEAGAVGCRQLNPDLSVQTCSIHRFPTILHEVFDAEFLRRMWPQAKFWGRRPLYNDSAQPAEVEAVSGACLMVKRNVFEKVGLLTVDYFMYVEDLDLCFKIHSAGLRIYHVGGARIIHYGGESSKQTSRSYWPALTQRKAVWQYLTRVHGRTYGFFYRLILVFSAAFRVGLICLAYPFATLFAKSGISSALAKWANILAWAAGVQREPRGSGSNA